MYIQQEYDISNLVHLVHSCAIVIVVLFTFVTLHLRIELESLELREVFMSDLKGYLKITSHTRLA